MSKLPRNIVLIAASTGGTRVLRDIFSGIGPLDAAIVIAQHLTVNADKLLAAGLGKMSGMPAVLPEAGQSLESGMIYLCPCGAHLLLDDRFRVQYSDSAPVNFVKPSADVMMMSVRRKPAGFLVGVVLTGIGCDGAEGVRHLKSLGAYNMAQSLNTCVIRDMPANAINTGCVDNVMPPQAIRQSLSTLQPQTI